LRAGESFYVAGLHHHRGESRRLIAAVDTTSGLAVPGWNPALGGSPSLILPIGSDIGVFGSSASLTISPRRISPWSRIGHAGCAICPRRKRQPPARGAAQSGGGRDPHRVHSGEGTDVTLAIHDVPVAKWCGCSITRAAIPASRKHASIRMLANGLYWAGYESAPSRSHASW
jgi:hypothetical protein